VRFGRAAYLRKYGPDINLRKRLRMVSALKLYDIGTVKISFKQATAEDVQNRIPVQSEQGLKLAADPNTCWKNRNIALEKGEKLERDPKRLSR